jgi:hypothetical protein
MRFPLSSAWIHPLLIAIIVAPVWIIPFYITQDGPAHAYDAKLLREWADPTLTLIRLHWTPDFQHSANWVCQGLMALLQHVMSPQAADKVVISLCTVLLAGGLAYWSRRVYQRFHPAELIGYLLAYSLMPLFGLYNYLLGIGISFFAVGWWWRHRDRMGVGRWVVFVVVTLVLYVTHLIALVFWIGTVGLYVAAEGIKTRASMRKRLGAIGCILLAFVTTAGYAIIENITIDTLNFKPFDIWLQYAARSTYLDTFRPSGIRGTLFAAWLIGTMFYAVRGVWTTALDPDHKERRFLLWMALIWTAALFLAPWSYYRDDRHYGSMVNERLPLLVVPLWVMTASLREKAWTVISTVFLSAMILWQAYAAVSEMNSIQPQIREFLSGTKLLAPHRSFRFEVQNLPNLDRIPDDYSSLEVMGKLTFHYGLSAKDLVWTGVKGHEVDNVWPHHFEANQTGLSDDYIITWDLDAKSKSAVTRGYRSIFKSKRLEIYQISS